MKALHSPDVAARFTEQGLDIVTSSPEELRALIQSDSARLGRIVREAGVKVE